MTTPPLAGPEARALGLLARAVAILRHRGVPNPEAMVARVAVDHLAPRAEQVTPIRRQPLRVVALTGMQLALFREVCEGRSRAEIRERHGMGVSTLNHHMADVCQAMGVRSTTEAVALVLTNQIGVRQKQRKAAA